MNRHLFFILTALMFVLTAAYLIVKRKLAQLSLSVVDIKFDKFGIKNIAGKLYLLIQNPFGNLEISNLKLDLYIDGYYVSSLDQGNSTTQRLPNGNLMAQVNFSLSPKKVVSMEHLLMSLANYGKNNYTVKGTITIKKWFLTVTIPIDYTDKFKSDEPNS